MKLPIELIEDILNYIDFDKISKISKTIADRIYGLNNKFYDFDDEDILHDAIRNGDLNIIKMLNYKNSKYFNNWTIEYAVLHDMLDIVIWLHTNRKDCCTKESVTNAAYIGSIAILEWLNLNVSEGWTPEAMDYASEQGHLDVVKWLHTNRREGCTQNALQLAFDNDNIDIMEFLYRNYSFNQSV